MTLLTELSDPSDINTLLTSQWNTEVIAKPSFLEGFLGDIQFDGNTVLVGWDQINFDDVDLGTVQDQIDNFFEVVMVSEHTTLATAKTNLLKILSEVRRILNKDITNGRWHLDSVIPVKNGNEQLFIGTLRETIYYIGD